eukprot:2064514-Amphidinium_carterae.2
MIGLVTRGPKGSPKAVLVHQKRLLVNKLQPVCAPHPRQTKLNTTPHRQSFAHEPMKNACWHTKVESVS